MSQAQIEDLHTFYQNEWWTRGRKLSDVAEAVAGSDVVVAYRDNGKLVGFARVLDVVSHPRLSGVRHFELYCLPELVPYYEHFGFTRAPGRVILMRRGS